MKVAEVVLPLGMVLAGIVTGLAWRIPSVERADMRAMRLVNLGDWPDPVDRVLRLLRIAGATPFFVVMLALVALARPLWAAGLTLAALAAELATMLLKRTVKRTRPFVADTGVVVRLSRLPADPSFPSADAMRAAFLSGLALADRAGATWIVWPVLLLAVVIGVGRVRAGAHYPLDVWTGLTIGLGAAIAWTATV